MNCFQLVKTVLDELYNDIPGRTDKAKDALINERLDYLSRRYSNLVGDTAPIDYGDPAVRFAYVYRYVTLHANLVYGRIAESEQLQSIFDAPRLTVSCIGGGPGSDLLGILKYMELTSSAAWLKCYLFDREERWSQAWCDVDQKIGKSGISTYFQRFDATDPTCVESTAKALRQSNLFTFTYFVSEMYSLRERAKPFFNELMQAAGYGAYFLYLDNNDSRFSSWFEEQARLNCLKLIEQRSSGIGLSYDEQKTDLGPYLARFRTPRLQGNVAYRLYAKQEIDVDSLV
ncbi:MAG: hypothetical protein U0X20_00350 [Caldilineaceae bacterium]